MQMHVSSVCMNTHTHTQKRANIPAVTYCIHTRVQTVYVYRYRYVCVCVCVCVCV